ETGTPEDAAALVEYVNGAANTKWGRRRAENGHREPYGVRTWNLGNEDYLPTLGAAHGAVYGDRYQVFAKAMRAVDPGIELVPVGAFPLPITPVPSQPFYEVLRYAIDWNRDVLPRVASLANYYSLHYYEPEDAVKDRSVRDINIAALASAEGLSAK